MASHYDVCTCAKLMHSNQRKIRSTTCQLHVKLFEEVIVIVVTRQRHSLHRRRFRCWFRCSLLGSRSSFCCRAAEAHSATRRLGSSAHGRFFWCCRNIHIVKTPWVLLLWFGFTITGGASFVSVGACDRAAILFLWNVTKVVPEVIVTI